jgi:hypothetical protein
MRRVAWLSLLMALLPLVVAAVRAAHEGWVPVGDAALLAVRTRDVLDGGAGGDVPSLGMWASTSWSLGFDINHPGPLLYWLLAVPAALVAGPVGIVVGTALVNCASVLGIFAAAWRRGGPVTALAAMAVTAGLCWSLGSAVLVEPWHASTVLLPFLLFLVLAWSLACGDLACLPAVVVVGSLVLQTNLAYAVLVPGVVVAGVAGYVVRTWRAGDGGVGRSRRSGAWLGLAALALVVCWVPPLVEQLRGDGRGNVSRLVDALGVELTTLDLADALRSVARVLAIPPWWARPSYGEAFPFGAFGNPLPSLGMALLALAAVAGVLGWRWHAARRGSGSGADAAVAVAGGALLIALSVASADRSPTSPFGTVAYQLRWLWPVGAFIALALVVSVVPVPGSVSREGDGAARRRRWAAVSLAAVTAVVSLANLPASDQGTTAPGWTVPVARRVNEAVAAADLEGPLLVTCGEHVVDPYCEAVMAELQRREVPFVVDGHIELRQLGGGRRWTGDNAVAELMIVSSDFAVFPRADQEVVTLQRGLSEDDEREMLRLRQELVEAIADDSLPLNDRGRRTAERGTLISVDPDGPPTIDPQRVVEVRQGLFGTYRRDLVVMAREDLLDTGPEGEWADELDRYADLQLAWDERTVTALLGPVPAGPHAET